MDLPSHNSYKKQKDKSFDSSCTGGHFSGFIVAYSDSIERINFQAKATKLELERFEENIDKAATERVEKAISEIQSEVEIQKKDLEKISSEAKRTKEEIQVIQSNISELLLIVTKITWLQAVTKNQIGGYRDTAAKEEITKELNRMLFTVIPDDSKRVEWVNSLESILKEN